MFRSTFNLTKFSLLLLVGAGFVSACIRSPCPDSDSNRGFGGLLSIPAVHPGCFKQAISTKKKPYFANVAYNCPRLERALGVIISKRYVLAKALNGVEAGKCNITVTVGANERGYGGSIYEAKLEPIGANNEEIMLLKLDKKLKFDDDVRKILMVDDKPDGNQKAVLIGLEHGPKQDVTFGYFEVDTNVPPNEECKNLLKSPSAYLKRFESHPNTFCTKPLHNDCSYGNTVLIVNDQLAGFGVEGFLTRSYEWIYSYIDISHLTAEIEDLYDFY